MRVTLQDVRHAYNARDPLLVGMVMILLSQEDPEPDQPIREGAATFDRFLAEIHSRNFRQKPVEEQQHLRVEQIKALEAADAEVPLSDRLRAHEILLELWEDKSVFARECLLDLVAQLPLQYGPWRAIKQIFKEAERCGDTEIFGAITARLDMAYATGRHEMSRRTIGYLVRRAWRYLRRLGQTLPACYADAAADVLAHYDDEITSHDWTRTWVANHVFYHETGDYAGKRFKLRTRPSSLLKHRAFGDLWRRTPRPLFSLLERAKCEHVRRYAATALKSDFRSQLREIEPAWVSRLVGVGSSTIDDFVIWILDNVPKFEQAAFRELGLHQSVLRLFDSESQNARKYAAEYARTHARDMPVEELIRLANNAHKAVQKVASDLITSRDPRKEIGLDAWGELLETENGHELAAAALRKHFGAAELTPEWFAQRLLGRSEHAADFARSRLSDVHPYKKLGARFFCELIDRVGSTSIGDDWQRQQIEDDTAEFALEVLVKNFDLNQLDTEFLQRSIVHPTTQSEVINWINAGRLKTESLSTEFYKTLAYHPQWEQDQWLAELKASDRAWAKSLRFLEYLSEIVLSWLGDVRRFSPADVGFQWLLQLVGRSEERYHNFAVETLIKAFVPADFATQQQEAKEEVADEEPPDDEIKVDLGKQSFLFTGKLATMSRKQAQDKVRDAGGSVASGVTAKLDYLVIGDEGSPLYGQGKKGSKQLKAESLRDEGSDVKIISETAFLQMLAGEQREFSQDAVEAGCLRLWDMATGEGKDDDPLRKFAIKFIRRHHPDICLAETDRPVDPGAEMPPEFLNFERFKPLFFDKRPRLRQFGLEMAKWEMSRWKPPIAGLVELCESPYPQVRGFIATALLADEAPEHRRYRIDAAVLTPDAVYSFCESKDESTRALGMELILRHPRLRVPDELFRLTESPDRKVRAFVVRSLWSLYRDRGTTQEWKPHVPQQANGQEKKSKGRKRGKEPRDYGEGAPPRPDQLPASQSAMQWLLRRMLFEIPPAKLEKSKADAKEVSVKMKLKPLPARRAKLALVEVMRDLAVEDVKFAGHVTPLLAEFMASRGKSEHAACLVAVTRIYHAHPDLAPAHANEAAEANAEEANA